MSYTEDQLWDLMNQGYDMPPGAAQIAMAEQIVAHADAQHLSQLSFQARLLATRAYTYGGEPAKAFVTFSWCVAEYDADPAERTRRHRRMVARPVFTPLRRRTPARRCRPSARLARQRVRVAPTRERRRAVTGRSPRGGTRQAPRPPTAG